MELIPRYTPELIKSDITNINTEKQLERFVETEAHLISSFTKGWFMDRASLFRIIKGLAGIAAERAGYIERCRIRTEKRNKIDELLKYKDRDNKKAIARSIYIMSNKSLRLIALEVGLNRNTITRLAKIEGWRDYRRKSVKL